MKILFTVRVVSYWNTLPRKAVDGVHGVQSQVRWGLENPHVVEGVPAYGCGVWSMWSLRSLLAQIIQWFYDDSMMLILRKDLSTLVPSTVVQTVENAVQCTLHMQYKSYSKPRWYLQSSPTNGMLHMPTESSDIPCSWYLTLVRVR